MTREELERLKIEKPSEDIFWQIKRNWDKMVKPLDGMGEFEELTAQIGAILGTEQLDIRKKAVIVMCADNGVVKEGISQSGQEVTKEVASLMGKNLSAVGRMAEQIGADVIPVDVGINAIEKIEGVLDKKIAYGTNNFLEKPAMTEAEMFKAIQTGIDMAWDCKEKGYHLIATGEMGIGNTTTSSAVAAALTGCDINEITARGAGLSDEGLEKKKRVIAEALNQYQFGKEETLRILQTVGGLDLAGMTGVILGGAIYQLPVVLDGVISVVAALVAERLKKGVRNYLIPSHKSKEPAAEIMLKELGLHPVLDASLALGEGTGAVFMFSLLDMAVGLYQKHTVFSDSKIEQYQRFERRKNDDSGNWR